MDSSLRGLNTTVMGLVLVALSEVSEYADIDLEPQRIRLHSHSEKSVSHGIWLREFYSYVPPPKLNFRSERFNFKARQHQISSIKMRRNGAKLGKRK